MERRLPPLLRLLITQQRLSEQQARQLVATDGAPQDPLMQLMATQVVSSTELLQILAEECVLSPYSLSPRLANAMNDELLLTPLIEQYHMLPFYDGQRWLLATADPLELNGLRDFSFSLNHPFEYVLVDYDQLTSCLEQIRQKHTTTEVSLQQLAEQAEVTTTVPTQQLDEQLAHGDGPLITYLNRLLSEAIHKGASDLHFEPYERSFRIRFRIDGLLHEIARPPKTLAPSLSARLKIMAALDIAERRLPQDGRLRHSLPDGQTVDFRVSTLPTHWGEKIVLRLLDTSSRPLSLNELGLNANQRMLFNDALQTPQGMILVTGPTGSGKTVTLYSGLHQLNQSYRNIATAEDPIEITMSGINQLQINPRIGLTFASALRAFLRQDPDVVMVGEIRDRETADIAIKAAQTGHLVLTTLHTNSAVEALTRLKNMGIAPYNIVGALSLVIAQRLLRRLCPHCKRVVPTPPEAKSPSSVVHYQPEGCTQCTDGFNGRIGIFEMLPLTPRLTARLLAGGDQATLQEVARSEGMVTLAESAQQRINAGETSANEVMRVIGNKVS